LKNIVQKKNLDERFELTEKLRDAEEKLQAAEDSVNEMSRNVEMQKQGKHLFDKIKKFRKKKFWSPQI
jgi:hypothetical protein